jgi:hypothetical protein
MARRQAILTSEAGTGRSRYEDCFTTLGETHDESAYAAIERLVQAGEQVGFTAPDLVRMLKGGMSLESLFGMIEVRMGGRCLHAESRVARN